MSTRKNRSRIMVFDVETSGLLPKDITDVPLEQLPYILQLSFVIFETNGWRVTKEANHYVKVSESVEIVSKITELTGITREMCNKGTPIQGVLNEFCAEYMNCDMIVAHNIHFDRRMIKLELQRNKDLMDPLYVNNTFNMEYEKQCDKINYCTMYGSRNLCKIERKNDKGETYFKAPKLSELYEHLFHTEPQNLHNSLVDTYICLRCLVKMRFKFDLKIPLHRFM